MEKNTIPFFKANDIKKLSKYSGKAYRKSNAEDVAAGKEIATKLTEKTAYWAEQSAISGFVSDPSYHWQIMGQFSKYTWARIYRKGHERYGVYFTVGVSFTDLNLVYKLDCQHTVANRGAKEKIELTKEQKDSFNDIIVGKDAEWQTISLKELGALNWDSLIHRTTTFIQNNVTLYDRAISSLWNIGGKSNPVNQLVLTAPPIGKTKGKNIKWNSPGGKTDYDKQRAHQKKIGDVGEEIVLKMEMKKLKEAGRADLAKKVRHVAKEDDSKGYDIYSYDENGEELFIEVKSTQGGQDKPWFVSLNELEFSITHARNYVLYRVYDLDIHIRYGKYFILKGRLDKSSFLEPVVYEAKIKP